MHGGITMIVQDLKVYKQAFKKAGYTYHTDLFNKAIWGDMGEDSASIALSVKDDAWFLSYVRTQSGEPLPLGGYQNNLIDSYERVLDDDELFEFLTHHNLQKEFESQCMQVSANSVATTAL